MIVLFAAVSLIAAPSAPSSMFVEKPLHALTVAPLDFPAVAVSFDRLSSCSNYLTKAMAGGDRSVALHRLSDLPDANMEVAVNRISRSSGCAEPVVVRYGVSR